VHRDSRVGLKPLKQQGHQRAMAADPTNGSGQGAEVSGTEADRTAQSPINKMELGKTA
jgi:hypothetical protein